MSKKDTLRRHLKKGSPREEILSEEVEHALEKEKLDYGTWNDNFKATIEVSISGFLFLYPSTDSFSLYPKSIF